MTDLSMTPNLSSMTPNLSSLSAKLTSSLSLSLPIVGFGSQRSSKSKETVEHSPGLYTIKYKCGLGETSEVGDLMAVIFAGQEVAALEVVEEEASHRIRARIARPSGWISLMNTETGFRWAEWARPLRPRDYELNSIEDEST